MKICIQLKHQSLNEASKIIHNPCLFKKKQMMTTTNKRIADTPKDVAKPEANGEKKTGQI